MVITVIKDHNNIFHIHEAKGLSRPSDQRGSLRKLLEKLDPIFREVVINHVSIIKLINRLRMINHHQSFNKRWENITPRPYTIFFLFNHMKTSPRPRNNYRPCIYETYTFLLFITYSQEDKNYR